MTFITPSPCTAGGSTPCVSESISSVGLCLGDGTPIAVIARSTAHNCGDAATPPVVAGWINLLTGAFTAGNPPAGTNSCSGKLDFEVAGLLCDIQPDGTSAATVAVEYEYDDVTGALIGTRIVNVATGTTYVPTGVLTPCGGSDGFEFEVLCDDVGQFLRQIRTNAAGVNTIADFALDGVTPYVVSGTVALCDTGVVFAGFVCDNSAGNPAIPATQPTCPGSALAAPANPLVGSGMTEGPAGTFTPTAISNQTYTYQGNPGDSLHGLCSIKFINDPGTGDDPFWQLIGSFIDVNGNSGTLDATWITAIETALGVGDASDIPAGSSATASIGGTAVTITFDGPSPHSQMFASNTAFFIREQDADGLAAGVTLDFNPPVRSFQVGGIVGTPTPGSISGLQESQATPGDAAIPATPASITPVKQFRNADGTSFYENLDGTPHTPLGTIGDCGDRDPQVLCDATNARFIRVYDISGGAIIGFTDYDLDGNLFAPTNPVGVCLTDPALFRDVEIEVLCDANGTTFLRKYLYDVTSGLAVSVNDTTLDGATGFIPALPVGPCDAASEVAFDVEGEVLCDSGASGFEFIRSYRYNPDGTLDGFSDFTFDGTPYVLLGTAELCGASNPPFQHEEILCDDNGPFLRKYIQDLNGVLIAVVNKDLEGVDYIPVGTVHVCENCESTVLGQICYVPAPNTIPAQTLTDTWAGSIITGPAGTGAHTWTNTNFGGAGITVIGTSSVSSTALPNSIQNFPPTSSFTLDLGAPRNNISIEIQDLDINESLTSISPAATAVNAPGVLSVGNTQLNTTVDNSFLFLTFPNGTQFITFTTHVPAGFQVAQRQITFDTIASSTAQTQGIASVVRDCETGAISYVDLATGTVIDIDTVTVVDCGDDTEVVTLCDNNGAFLRRFTYDSSGAIVSTVDTDLTGAAYVPVGPVVFCSAAAASAVVLNSQMVSVTPGSPWTPALVTGTLTSVTMTVVAGTADVTDSNATVTTGIPTGYSTTWNALDQNTLTGPQSIASVGGTTLVVWTQK